MPELIRQRFRDDCSVCCIAMALGWSWERAFTAAIMADFEPRWLSGLRAVGYRPGNGTSSPYQLLARLNLPVLSFEPSGLPAAVLSKMLWGRRAILSVPSKNGWRGWHDVYWDGGVLHDPSNGDRYGALCEVSPTAVILFHERMEQ